MNNHLMVLSVFCVLSSVSPAIAHVSLDHIYHHGALNVSVGGLTAALIILFVTWALKRHVADR